MTTATLKNQFNVSEGQVKLQASFIADNMQGGMSFEKALEKSFNDVNSFLVKMRDSDYAQEKVFKAAKNIINKNV